MIPEWLRAIAAVAWLLVAWWAIGRTMFRNHAQSWLAKFVAPVLAVLMAAYGAFGMAFGSGPNKRAIWPEWDTRMGQAADYLESRGDRD